MTIELTSEELDIVLRALRRAIMTSEAPFADDGPVKKLLEHNRDEYQSVWNKLNSQKA
jgi:hypothetical protein